MVSWVINFLAVQMGHGTTILVPLIITMTPLSLFNLVLMIVVLHHSVGLIRVSIATMSVFSVLLFLHDRRTSSSEELWLVRIVLAMLRSWHLWGRQGRLYGHLLLFLIVFSVPFLLVLVVRLMVLHRLYLRLPWVSE